MKNAVDTKISRCATILAALSFAGCAHSGEILSIEPNATVITVNLTASPTTGTCPYSSNLSWSATNASACTKSGSWSGSAGASGSQPVEINSAQMTFTLTCSAATESATVRWTNPTQNVDGSAATLKGNKVYHAAISNDVANAPPIVLTPATTSYVLTGLPAGPRYVGVRATSNVSPFFDSDMAGPATTTITLPSGAATVQATCSTPPTPKPPTAVTISSTVWDSIPGREGIYVGRDVGTIEVGIECVGQEPVTVQAGEADVPAEYWAVRREDVTLYRKPRSEVVLARCVLPS
jgi:hypothetical protein